MQVFADAGCHEVARRPAPACLAAVDTFGRTRGSEVVISTTNRQLRRTNGVEASSITWRPPLTVAASAVTGHITDPREFM